MALGTVIYMSPEQYANSKDVDARSDLFSLGLIAHTALSGLALKDRRNAMLASIPRLSDVSRIGWPEPLAEWIARMAVRRDERFPDSAIARARFAGVGRRWLVAARPCAGREPRSRRGHRERYRNIDRSEHDDSAAEVSARPGPNLANEVGARTPISRSELVASTNRAKRPRCSCATIANAAAMASRLKGCGSSMKASRCLLRLDLAARAHAPQLPGEVSGLPADA